LNNGLGKKGLNNILSLINVPSISKYKYKKMNYLLTDKIDKLLKDSTSEAIQKEKDYFTDIDQFSKSGKIKISCVGDGAWSKRSYKTNYIANSGAAVLIGMQTKKILYLGVKNKYCYYCNSKIDIIKQANHICFKYWQGSSTSMESKIILEGFQTLSEDYDVEIHRCVGDADSNVMANLRLSFSWGDEIEKVDCLNHCTKNI
jgi:hypothetical protein